MVKINIFSISLPKKTVVGPRPCWRRWLRDNDIHRFLTSKEPIIVGIKVYDEDTFRNPEFVGEIENIQISDRFGIPFMANYTNKSLSQYAFLR